MIHLFAAGSLGRDAEYKTTQSGSELCSFSMAVNSGFGESKTTIWLDVSKWGKGAEGLARILRKGSKVAVSGEMSLHENNGKTYVKCRATDVTIMGTPGQQAGSQGAPADNGRQWDDEPDPPFITSAGIY